MANINDLICGSKLALKYTKRYLENYIEYIEKDLQTLKEPFLIKGSKKELQEKRRDLEVIMKAYEMFYDKNDELKEQ